MIDGSAEPPTEDLLLVDDPVEGVRRLTMNRPQKRNALNHPLRGAILDALTAADIDESVRVTVLRGAGTCFSAGYDLGGGNEGHALPYPTAPGDGQWPRHVTDGWMGIWELAKPVNDQVNGWCLAGGSELATGCDLVYVATDASLGYPAVRFGVPDMHFHTWFLGMRKAMEMMVTGDHLSGTEAVEWGWANAAFPVEDLEDEVLAVATRIAAMPPDVVQLNKRAVHRQMEYMGIRSGIRAGTELCALAVHTDAMANFLEGVKQTGLKAALQRRDEPFGDYRTAGNLPPAGGPSEP